MSITIRDVARAAGVSVTTVSRAFNQSGLVSSETRTRILSAAERLRYVPNAAARNLSIRQRRVLGLLVPLPHSEFFIEVIRGMDEAAFRLGYLLLISSSHNRLEDTRTAFRSMKGQVDGFMVVAPNVGRDALQHVLPQDVPVVFLNSPSLAGAYPAIHPQNRQGAIQAVRHLISLGHERIGIVTGPANNGEAQERLVAYREALLEAGLEVNPSWQLAGEFTRESGVEAGHALLALPQRPTAVFASNDLMAIGLLTVFHSAGVRVPEDIALIGFDDIPMTQYVQPPLSTIHVPIPDMGRLAVERLVALIGQGEAHLATTDQLETSLVVRASTVGAAARRDRHHRLSPTT